MKKLFFLIILIFSLIALSFYGNYQSFLQKEIIEEKNFILEVKEGSTLYSLAKELNIDTKLFKIYLKLNPLDSDFELQAGKYKIPQGSTISEFIESLEKPINEDLRLTFLEGWNIYDIDEYLTNKGFINKGAFIEKAQNNFEDFLLDFRFLENVKTLEGYLYPDTYNINPNSFTIDSLIYTLLETFNNKVIMQLEKEYSPQELLEIITLASIVEKEEKNSEEKARVAGVLKKRLEQGWMLGADATVCYPYALTSEECKMVVSKYINEENDYNTRTMLGIPATPIANPSAETIFATIKSEETPYYFYLHDSNDIIHYAIDNAGHEANKAKYLR